MECAFSLLCLISLGKCSWVSKKVKLCSVLKSFFFTIAGVILGFEVLVSPSLRTKLAQIVERKDIGKCYFKHE